MRNTILQPLAFGTSSYSLHFVILSVFFFEMLSQNVLFRIHRSHMEKFSSENVSYG